MSDGESRSESGDNRRGRQAGPLAGCLVLVLLFAPPLYVLSLGPAIWLFKHGYISKETGIVYAPLGYLGNNFEPARKALNWYLELWGGP
jgi:hypothetical protein